SDRPARRRSAQRNVGGAARAGVVGWRAADARAALGTAVSVAHSFEAFAIDVLSRATRTRSWPKALALGERLGSAAYALGIRRKVALANLAIAFPERSESER